ncbi:MAG: hypothetical protein IPH10_11075 [bacterium]|nr:hypothetical protein [bacterium]
MIEFCERKWHTPIALVNNADELAGWREVSVAVYVNADAAASKFCLEPVR